MSENNQTDNPKILRKVASNLPRAGLLAIPAFGSAIEKAIYGPIDDIAKEKEVQQFRDSLAALQNDVNFLNANLENQIKMLAEALFESNAQLSNKISEMKSTSIENVIINEIKPVFIQIILTIDRERLSPFFNAAGMLPGEFSNTDAQSNLGEVLLDRATEKGTVQELLYEAVSSNPSLFEKFSERGSFFETEDLIKRFRNASRLLLSWPTTVGNSRWLPRVELKILEERINGSSKSTNMILGRPGTGKSALLSSLGRKFRDDNIPVLAIKADMIPKSVTNLVELTSYLNLPFPVLTGCTPDITYGTRENGN